MLKYPEKTKSLNFNKTIASSSLPRPETELLLTFLLNKNREFLLTHPETEINQTIYKKFKILEAKRLKNWPLAYLTGHKEFYGLDFKVSSATLVPRPETEMIAEKVIVLIKSEDTAELPETAPRRYRPFIIDLGTGSGAIIIALTKELKHLMPTIYRRAQFSAVDISHSALKIAARNVKIHKLEKKIKFYRGDLLTPLKLNNQPQDLIIAANLPYLTLKQIKESPTISREPKLALHGGRDGLKYYRRLFQQLKRITYRSATIFCEIDPGQTKKITALAARYFPAANSRLAKDYSGQNRLFIIKIRP